MSGVVSRRLPCDRVPDAAAARHRPLDVRAASIGIGVRRAFVAMTTLAGCGCGPSPITSTRIETAIETDVRQPRRTSGRATGAARHDCARLRGDGHLPQALARQRRRDPATGSARSSGRVPTAGLCATRTSLSITTDGCYTATVAGESLGGPTLKAPDGSAGEKPSLCVRGLLRHHVMEGWNRILRSAVGRSRARASRPAILSFRCVLPLPRSLACVLFFTCVSSRAPSRRRAAS